MTTIEKDIALPWDAFLQRELQRLGLTGLAAEKWLEQTRNHIERFRQMEWPQIRLGVNKTTTWQIPEGLEPHWVEPGKAVFWQEQIVRTRVSDSDGVRIEERHLGWTPTSAIYANSASAVAKWLDIGLRLRPPTKDTDLEVLKRANIQEYKPVTPVPTPKFWCRRHPDKGPMAFPNWKAYIQHCTHYLELPIEEPPQEVVEHRKQFKWYCLEHEKGFNFSRLASRHMKSELRKPGKRVHQTLAQMEVT